MMARKFTLVDRNCEPYESETAGTLGGYQKGGIRIYGRLDCPSAFRHLTNGKKHRVFFADEITDVSAGFRPCGTCLRKTFVEWKRCPSEWRKLRTRALLWEIQRITEPQF